MARFTFFFLHIARRIGIVITFDFLRTHLLRRRQRIDRQLDIFGTRLIGNREFGFVFVVIGFGLFRRDLYLGDELIRRDIDHRNFARLFRRFQITNNTGFWHEAGVTDAGSKLLALHIASQHGLKALRRVALRFEKSLVAAGNKFSLVKECTFGRNAITQRRVTDFHAARLGRFGKQFLVNQIVQNRFAHIRRIHDRRIDVAAELALELLQLATQCIVKFG